MHCALSVYCCPPIPPRPCLLLMAMLAVLHSHLLPQHSSSKGPPATPASSSARRDEFVLANGLAMPAIGLGCAYVDGSDVSRRSQHEISTEMVEHAIASGYRAFDTAQRYGTEAPLGEALARHFRKGTLRRDEVFITTKTSNPRPGSGGMPAGGGWGPDGKGYMLCNDIDARAGIVAELEACLRTLQLDHVDLCLIHYPSLPASDGPALDQQASRRKRRECWAGLQDLYDAGKCRAIGVSNFGVNHLEDLFNCAPFPMHPSAFLGIQITSTSTHAWVRMEKMGSQKR